MRASRYVAFWPEPPSPATAAGGGFLAGNGENEGEGRGKERMLLVCLVPAVHRRRTTTTHRQSQPPPATATGGGSLILKTHMVKLRRKLDDKTSKDMIGNMFWIATAVCKRSEGVTLSDLVNKVHESIAKIDNEFVSKAQGDEEYVVFKDSLKEMGKIGELGDLDNCSFTSTCNMGFYDVDFGWGKPGWVTCYVCEGMSVFVNLVTLMDTKCGEGIEAWVTLDEEEMRILECNEELLTYASLVTK